MKPFISLKDLFGSGSPVMIISITPRSCGSSSRQARRPDGSLGGRYLPPGLPDTLKCYGLLVFPVQRPHGGPGKQGGEPGLVKTPPFATVIQSFKSFIPTSATDTGNTPILRLAKPPLSCRRKLIRVLPAKTSTSSIERRSWAPARRSSGAAYNGPRACRDR
jgi:hypothetical protein